MSENELLVIQNEIPNKIIYWGSAILLFLLIIILVLANTINIPFYLPCYLDNTNYEPGNVITVSIRKEYKKYFSVNKTIRLLVKNSVTRENIIIFSRLINIQSADNGEDCYTLNILAQSIGEILEIFSNPKMYSSAQYLSPEISLVDILL